MIKKILAGLLAAGICVALSSCKNENIDKPGTDNPGQIENDVVEITKDPLYHISTRDLEDSVAVKDTEEIVFTKKVQNVRVTAFDRDYSETAKKIVATMSSAEKRANSQAAEIKNMSMELLAQGQTGLSFPFCFETTYHEGRNDGAVVCIIEKAYYNSGGPHPYHADFGYNFDAQTGEHLNFEAVLPEDFDIESLLFNKLNEKYPGMIDPQNFIMPELSKIADDSWVFTDDGIDVWFNVYDIAPYAGGTFEIEISKDELPKETLKYFIEE